MSSSVQTVAPGTGHLSGESRVGRASDNVDRQSRTERPAGVLGRWMAKTYELSGDSARLHSMEGLRGFAVLLVFFVHFHALFADYVKDEPQLWHISAFLGNVGNAGVDMFFVLSGYLIYGALMRHKSSLPRFLARRAARIYPTFLAVFALYLALSVVFPQSSKLEGYRPAALGLYLAQNLLLLPGIFSIVPIITVSWSLSYEMVFYTSVAALIYGIQFWKWAAAWRIALLVAISIAYTALCFSMHHSHIRVLMFMAGIFLAEGLYSARFRALLTGPWEGVAIIAFVFSLIYSYLLDVRPELFSSLPGWGEGRSVLLGVSGYQGPYKTLALGLCMFWFLSYCFAHDGYLNRLFRILPLRFLGNMSYSYYLIHGVALQGVALLWGMRWRHGAPSVPAFTLGFFAGFAATWLAATALFLLVEKPFSLGRATLPKGSKL